MRSSANFADDALIQFASVLAARINRNSLQHILIDARLLSRNVSRDDARKQCPNSHAWVNHVAQRLRHDDQRPSALRALTLLSTAYLSTNIDHRIETSIRKARQAAERGDATRIVREYENLKEYAVEIASPELLNPELLIFLSAGSGRARESVAQALETVQEIEHTNELSALAKPVETKPEIPSTVPAIIPAPKPREQDSVLSELVRELTELAEIVPTLPAWNIENLLRARLPSTKVDWPDTSVIRQQIAELEAALKAAADVCKNLTPTVNTTRQLATALQALRPSLSLSFEQSVADVTRAAEEVGATVERLLSMVDQELRVEAERIRQSFVSETTQSLQDDLMRLLTTNQSLVERKAAKIIETVQQLATLASYLPEDMQRGIEMKTRHLALHLRPDELQRLVQDTEAKTEEPRRLRQRVKDAASSTLTFLRATTGLRVDNELKDRVCNAVAQGDGDAALRFIQDSTKPMTPVLGTPRGQTSITRQAPTAPPIVSINESPALSSNVNGFVPRDRVTAKDPRMPKTPNAMVTFLRDRCLSEIERGSLAGALDHALDILALADGNSAGDEYWSKVGLTLIAALPPVPENAGWARSLAATLRESLQYVDSATLANYVSNLVLQPHFDEAISERLVYTEIGRFSSSLMGAMYTGISVHRPYLLEDVARALGTGAVFGDPASSRNLLQSLAVAAAESEEVQRHTKNWLESDKAYSTAAQKSRVPDWLAEGIKSYHMALTERNKVLIRTTARPGSIRVQVPVSVSKSGGFGYLSGSDEVDFALLVSNHQSRPLSSVEISLPVVRNKWLSEDVICFVGSLGGNARHLVQIRVHLAHELVTDTSFEVGLQVRYREPGVRESKFEDMRIEVGFATARSLAIQNYEGAGGKPLIFEGEALRYSSNSVKRALSEIISGLSGKGIGALVIGRRRRGKTSILQTVAQHADVRSRYTIVSDAWEDIPSRSLQVTLRHFGMVFDRAARTLNIDIDSLELRLTTDISGGWTTIQHWLDDFADKVKSPVRLLVLLDEFQKWLTLLDFESRSRILYILRGLFNRPANGNLSVSVVLSGLTNIREFTKASADFENAFQIFSIEAFNLAEADALIRSNPSIEFDSRAVVWIRDLAGGNPFLINLLCNDITNRLRELGRAYCLPEDVERVVKSQLDERNNSRVWNFLQYMLREGEEDHASEIPEMAALLALAYTRKMRGAGRVFLGIEEIIAEMLAAEVACDRESLSQQLASAVKDELLIQRAQRYGFANGWLAEWLSVGENLLPIKPEPDKDLVLGRFRLGKFIERGGQANVYEAQDTRSANRTVIVKIYPRTQQSGVGTGVMREARLLHSIEHHAVVQCIDYGSDTDKGDVIVLERIKGDTLRELISKCPKYAVDLIGCDGNIRVQIKFLEQIAAALAECHRLGVVHKDLKPENIIVQQNTGLWVPKIIDFGLATNISELGNEVIRTGGSYTPGYVAPERYRGEGRRSPADIYSLGVIAYEILAGVPPFSTDPLAAREAQEVGAFSSLKDVRTTIPARLSELIGEMMSPDPTIRPNALTLLGRLAPALETSDWVSDLESGRKAYEQVDAETACHYFERAAFGAPEAGRRTSEYFEALTYMADSAESCGRILNIAGETIQPFAAAAMLNEACAGSFERFVKNVLAVPAVDSTKREWQRNAIRTLVELLSDLPPNMALLKIVEFLLRSSHHPAVWPDREGVYLLGLAYKDANIIALALVAGWCVTCARKIRERDANLLACQIWMRRAERMGLGSSAEYRAENDILQKLFRKTATPITLPAIAQQEPATKTVGEGERGHLNVSRIQKWVERLLRLHPYVQAVRRVKKDPHLPGSPTRILSLDNIAQHLIAGSEPIEGARIIPAVLDESYCIPKGCPLRINIVLPKGSTLVQREAAIELLKSDTSLFGDVA